MPKITIHRADRTPIKFVKCGTEATLVSPVEVEVDDGDFIILGEDGTIFASPGMVLIDKEPDISLPSHLIFDRILSGTVLTT